MTPQRALVVACVIMAIALPFSFAVGDPVDRLVGTVELDQPLAVAIPTSLDEWELARENELGERVEQITKVDDYISRVYRGRDGAEVLLYVAFHGNKERGLQTYYHNATVCYPAAGWDLVGEEFETLTLHDAARQLPVCRYRFERSGERLSVLTFFRVDGEVLDQSPRNKPFWMLAERLSPPIDDSPGTFVQVQVVVRVAAGMSDTDAAIRQVRFLQTFGGSILQAVP